MGDINFVVMSISLEVNDATGMLTNLFRQYHPTHSTSERTFRAIVGCDASIVAVIWTKYLQEEGFEGIVLLWMCSFFHLYPRNDIAAAGQWGVSDRTFFPKVWNLANFLFEYIDEVSIPR